MKLKNRLLPLLLAFVCLFVLSACGKTEKTQKSESSDKKNISGNFEWDSVNYPYSLVIYFKEKRFEMYEVDSGNPMLHDGSYVLDETNKTIEMKCDTVEFDSPIGWENFKAEGSTVSYELSNDNKELTLTFEGVAIKFKKDK